jgi:KaiC/GvpD/RAD55 family RecA-like ATPase
LDRVPTGIKGLDELLGGGFPKGKCILVVGSPGSGKTTFAIQYLYSGALQGETGLYVTLDEYPDMIKQNFQSYNWDLDSVEKKGRLLFLDASGLRRAKTKNNGPHPLFSSDSSEGVGFTEFLSPGVVVLHTLMHQGNFVRAVQVEKMRGIAHDTQIRPYQFGTSGIEVFPRDKVF